MAVSHTEDRVRFGLFELDLKAGQLSKNGTRIRLPQQPLQLLSVLLERPGEILTREELRQRLWSSDVFVDFDHGLNKSIQKLRDSLGDSADSPRYIETIPRVGYRFIAPVDNFAGGIKRAVQESNGNIPQTATDSPVTAPAGAMIGKIGSQRVRWFLLAACLISLATITAWLIHKRLHATEPIRSLAVLPLDNLSGDSGQDYFADGMTDELTTMLAKNSTLRIVSRTSAMQYKGAHRPLRDIARELGVDGILEGSVERTGDKVHMTIQLIQAPSDTHVWAESYDRNANDVVSLPMEAAQTIATRLNSAFFQPAPRYINPQAHDAYLRGLYLWEGGQDEAGKYFKLATDLQPDYALGWTGLADYYGQGASVNLDPEDALPKGEAAAAKALELDPSLAQAHLSMGAAIFAREWDWARGDREVLRAIELDPRLAQAYHFHAMILAVLNRHAEAIEVQKKATELDSFARPWALPRAFFWARQYDAALKEGLSRLEASPNVAGLNFIVSEIYWGKRMDKEAAQYLLKGLLLTGDKGSAASVQHAYEQGGYQALVVWQLRDLERQSKTHYVSPLNMAKLNAKLGDRERTISLLQQGLQTRSRDVLWIQCEPAYDFLHSDPRYRAIVKQIGLPPAW